MRIKYYLLLTLVSFMVCKQANGQSCEQLYRKAIQQMIENKRTEAQKTFQQVKNCDDREFQKKADDVLKPMLASQKKTVKATALTLSEEEVVIPYQGGEYPVIVYGVNSWKANVESDWCSIRKEGHTIVIKCQDENPTMQRRIANVIVTSGSRSRTIVVNNEGAPEMLRSSVNSLSFPSDGDKNEVDVYSNTIWRVDSVPQWVTVRSSDKHVVFTAEPNKQNVKRVGNVVISTPTSSTVVIRVYQGAGDEELAFSKNNLTFGPDGGDEYIKVYTNADVWKFGDFPSWCQVTRIGEDSIKIHCAPNEPIDLIREGSVNVTTGFQTLGINISQEAKPYPYLVPKMGIGGRSLSFGVNAGLVMPIISASADGFTGSVVNYALGNNNEAASYKSGVGFTMGVFADIRLYNNIYLIAGINYLQYSYKNEFKSDVYRRIYQTERYYQAGNTQNSYEEEYKMAQLEVPILASYRFPITKMSHLQVNLGPVFNYGLSAKMKINGYTSSESTYYYAIENGQMTDELYDKQIQSIRDKGNGEFDLYDKHVNYQVIDKGGQTLNKDNNLEDSPMKRFNAGARIGVVYEYYGFSIGAEFTYMFTNMANDKYWEGNRWRIFDQSLSSFMSGYKQRNHYLGIKLGYTFRY